MNGIEYGDILNILSLMVGLKNLDLNQAQVTDLMNEMKLHQNELIEKAIKQNEIIIKQNEDILEVVRNAQKINKENS